MLVALARKQLAFVLANASGYHLQFQAFDKIITSPGR